jgi:hypothetical protein
MKAQVATTPFVRVSKELNLGVAYSYKAIIETLNLYLSSQASTVNTLRGLCALVGA